MLISFGEISYVAWNDGQIVLLSAEQMKVIKFLGHHLVLFVNQCLNLLSLRTQLLKHTFRPMMAKHGRNM